MKDVRINLLPTFTSNHPAFIQFPEHVHGEPGYRRVWWKRKIECAFGVPRIVIKESLVDCRSSDAIFDIDVDVVLAKRQSSFLTIGIDGDQTVFLVGFLNKTFGLL